MADNVYGQVVMLLKQDLDYKELIYRLAATHPDILLRIIHMNVDIELQDTEDVILIQKVLSLIKAGQKIMAIKEIRAVKNMGLKEAKDFCDALQEKHGIVVNYGG